MTPRSQNAPVDAVHVFTSTWRWPPAFENWVADLVDGRVANICAGLSPLGDVRVDVMTPCEIVGAMQEDGRTDLEDARAALDGVLPDAYVGRDIVQELYEARDPTAHPLGEHLTSGATVKADVINEGIPLADDSFEWTICDPPWKEIDRAARHHLFDEIVRITAPDGHILFNAPWIPTSDAVTLDTLRIQQDLDRHPTGTPSVSYAGIYTVHTSKHVARYLSRTFTTREYVPEPASLTQALEAEIAFRLERVRGLDAEAYDVRAVGPTTDYRCPHCGATALTLATTAAGYDPPADGALYACRGCEYPVSESELEQIAAGHLQRVRHDAGFSRVSEAELTGVDPDDPPDDLRYELVGEPGIAPDAVDDYLRAALPVGNDSLDEDASLDAFLDEGTSRGEPSKSGQVTLSEVI